MENIDKMVLVKEIEALIESDPCAPIASFALLEFLEINELQSVKETLLRSKANRSAENEKWFDTLCQK